MSVDMGQSFVLELQPVGAAGGTDGALIGVYTPELDQMRATVIEFPNMDPADVLMALSGISGRLAEMRAQLMRADSKRCTALRTREVDPLRDELDLQFRIHSRRIALMEWEMRLQGGAV